MATDQDDRDIPESGGVFTFGKSKFAENLPNKFWIRNDEVTQVACGDQHTVLFAESGRVFVFGDNSYGQLGLGNTKAQTKPTCVKSLKGEQVSVIGCGSDHTLVGTSSGVLFSFGKNNYHQCGLDAEGSIETPTEVLLEKPIVFTQLCGGSSHSIGLDKSGTVYVWGDNSEGQLGLGDGVTEAELPTKLGLDERAVHVACGYYHSAVVTASGKLYTFGEEEGGKLGHGDGVLASEPLEVNIPDRIVWASCGGKHTVAVTAKGAVYSFGDGSDGQLGQGTNTMECSRPQPITYLKDITIKYTSCGENFTAAVSERGQLYTFGNGRHGKLALGAENFTNQFRPFRVPRFAKFSVTVVSCGGCHTITLAHKKDENDYGEDEEIHDPLNSTFANSLRLSTDLDSSISARDRRRSKEGTESLSRTLPSLTKLTHRPALPPLSSSSLQPLDGTKLPSTLDKRKLPNAKFLQADKDDDSEDSEVSVTPEGSSEEEEEATAQQSMKNKREAMKRQSVSLANGKGKPQSKKPLPKPNSRDQRESADRDSEDESEDEKYRHKKKVDSRESKSTSKSRGKKELESGDDSEEEEMTSKHRKSLASKNKKNQKKRLDSEDEGDSALENSEEEDEEEITPKKSGKKNSKSLSKDKRRKSKMDSEEEEEEDSETENRKSKANSNKSRLSIFGKGQKNAQDLSDEDEEEEEEEEKPSKSKGKQVKSKKSKKAKESEEEEEGDDDDEEDDKGKSGSKKDLKQSTNNNNTTEDKPVEKKSRACTIL